jgi:hypothetical protein
MQVLPNVKQNRGGKDLGYSVYHIVERHKIFFLYFI